MLSEKMSSCGKVPLVPPIETKHERVLYNLGRGALRMGREQHVRSRSADGRAGRAFDSARRMVELVACSIQFGHLSSRMGSVR
ncbi:hypothetical protein IGI04_039646 [Brassica rapa subsp. trilocularis]|uniref:Uncharacterized protein n=1 Tax=Brassica rapa subsp. trilocularis TaxID=1813537 RepID=A0ABQ7KNI4_BRACM|nr:hypothetical protein IGI04_039646 [Brassica rapa subsp. trilocularis]